MEVKKEHVDKVLDLAKLSLAFAKVNRVTHHEDGVRNESDTDHSFMLSIIASSLADTFYKNRLDIGLISQFAILHDLVEVYAGDTDTFLNNDEQSRKEKNNREMEALQKIGTEFDREFPWAHRMITEYETQSSKESRFVKLIDKMLPELTHILNNFSYINGSGMGKDYFYNFIKDKKDFLCEKYTDEFPEILFLYEFIVQKMFDCYEIKNK